MWSPTPDEPHPPSEEHQSQLLRAGGLPLMIQLLAESQDEELKRAATFVLQTCKQMRAFEASSPPQADPGGLQERVRPFCDMPSYWRSALEIKERIKQLEKLHREVDEGERDATNSTDKRRGLPGVETPLLTLDPTAGFWEGTGVQRTLCRGEERGLAHEGYKDPIESRELTPARPALQPYRHQKREGNSRSPVEYPTSFSVIKDEAQREEKEPHVLLGLAVTESGNQEADFLGQCCGRDIDTSAVTTRRQTGPEPQRKARSSAPQPPGGASQPREPAEQGAAVCSVCSRMPDSSTPPATGGGRERDGEGGPPTAPPESSTCNSYTARVGAHSFRSSLWIGVVLPALPLSHTLYLVETQGRSRFPDQQAGVGGGDVPGRSRTCIFSSQPPRAQFINMSVPISVAIAVAAGGRRENMIDHMSLCSDILEGEIMVDRMQLNPTGQKPSMANILLSVLHQIKLYVPPGVFLLSRETGARTFTQILRSCRYRCDRHTVLMDAEDRFKTRVQETIRKEKGCHCSLPTPDPQLPPPTPRVPLGLQYSQNSCVLHAASSLHPSSSKRLRAGPCTELL
ncbi:hypothetical protein JZ751_020875 [Albula glossodonta]|uniref:Uncharacterized protein n=1 Tax=Albula glossodonta TaxID=121402 RepID=A0A8T2PLT1_9TELE|nr:hypothetical protein JZ751_020875 [Albula glossodonta]